MTPHLSEEQVALYRNRSLAAAELLRASEHIAGCKTCRARIASQSELYAEVEAFRAILDAEAANPPHLTYDEMAAYVDQQSKGEAAAQVEKHVQECRSCAAELAGIEAVKRELEATERSQGWFERISGLWKETFGWKGTFVLAGAAACGLLVLLVVRKPVPEAVNQQASARPQPIRPPAGIPDGVTIAAGLPEALRASLTRVIATQQIERPAILDDLTGKRGVLLGSSTAPSGVELLGPVGIVVESQSPTLRWKPIAGAEYRVSVYSDGYEEAATSGWLHSAEWQITKGLRRGARYSWQLSVRHNGAEFTVPAPPAPEARFKVLDAAGEAEIAQLKTIGTGSHMLLGIHFAQLGALDEAERELRQAHEQTPDSSIVSALLSGVERLRITTP